MGNYDTKFEEAYSFIANNHLDKAKIIFENIYKEVNNESKTKDNSFFYNISRCILGLAEIYMKLGEFKKSLKYYNLGNNLKGGKDFNILFNMGVLYRNIGDIENSNITLNKAKALEPNNINLSRFLSENNDPSKSIDPDVDIKPSNNGNNNGNNRNNSNNISFEDKVKKMMKDIQK